MKNPRTRSLSGRRKGQAAFTLVEIMVVLVILGLLAGIVVKSFAGRVDIAKRKTAIIQIRELADAVEMFRADNGFYPSNDVGLRALVERPHDAKVWPADGYLKGKTVPDDPWGAEYLYVCPGSDGPFDIICYGVDKREGGAGVDADVSNHTLHKEQ